jgi:hypothetical protein
VARSGQLCGVGIDAEPHAALPTDMLDFVLRDEERRRLLTLADADPVVHWDRLVFCAKEAVYKGRWKAIAAWSSLRRRCSHDERADRSPGDRKRLRRRAVEEADTIRTCHRLARRGFLFGGSTGTVVSGAVEWLAEHGTPELTSVAIAPDLGERYLDTVYQPDWVEEFYGEDVLDTEPRPSHRFRRADRQVATLG